MCKHVPVKPCQPLIGSCVAEEEVFEPTAESLKSEYAFVLPKKIIHGLVFVRNPHSLEVKIGCGSSGTVDGVIDLIRSRVAGSRSETILVKLPSIAGISAAILDALSRCRRQDKPPALREQFPADFWPRHDLSDTYRLEGKRIKRRCMVIEKLYCSFLRAVPNSGQHFLNLAHRQP